MFVEVGGGGEEKWGEGEERWGGNDVLSAPLYIYTKAGKERAESYSSIALTTQYDVTESRICIVQYCIKDCIRDLFSLIVYNSRK